MFLLSLSVRYNLEPHSSSIPVRHVDHNGHMESVAQTVTSLRSQSPFQGQHILLIINKSARITRNGEIGQLDKRDALEPGLLIGNEFKLHLGVVDVCASWFLEAF